MCNKKEASHETPQEVFFPVLLFVTAVLLAGCSGAGAGGSNSGDGNTGENGGTSGATVGSGAPSHGATGVSTDTGNPKVTITFSEEIREPGENSTNFYESGGGVGGVACG